MANIKSQKKRIRTNERARLRNQAIKSALRTDIRSFREAAEAGDKDKATEALRAASRSLDKAVSKGVIHTRTRQLTRSLPWLIKLTVSKAFKDLTSTNAA